MNPHIASAHITAGAAPRMTPRAEGLRIGWRTVVASFLAAFVVALAAMTMTIRSSQGFAVYSDGLVYFLYARSVVIDHDAYIGNEFDDLNARVAADSKAMEPLRKWTSRRADGTLVSPWPAGTGYLLAPFYAAGYAVERAVASTRGREPDSYGLIPQIAFGLGCVALGMMGVWCLYLAAREVADTGVAALSSAGVALSGPVLFYVLFHPSMAHAPSLGLVALMTWLWLRAWLRGASMGTMAAMGLLLGIAATVRYQNALYGVLLVALVLREWSRSGFVVAAKQAVAGLAACLIPVAALLAPQLTVGSAGSGVSVAQYPLDPASPYFFSVLFSCRHGAFHWAPLLGMSVLGLFFAARRERWGLVLLVVLALNAWLIGGLSMAASAFGGHAAEPGWLHHWDDAPSFGMRYLTECAPVFALGLALLIGQTRRFVGLLGWSAVIAASAAWNAMLVVAYGLETITRSGCLPYGDMLEGIGRVFAKVLHI
jgi:hypothetical protein